MLLSSNLKEISSNKKNEIKARAASELNKILQLHLQMLPLMRKTDLNFGALDTEFFRVLSYFSDISEAASSFDCLVDSICFCFVFHLLIVYIFSRGFFYAWHLFKTAFDDYFACFTIIYFCIILENKKRKQGKKTNQINCLKNDNYRYHLPLDTKFINRSRCL